MEYNAYQNSYGHTRAMDIQRDLESYSEETRNTASQHHYQNTQERQPTHGPYPVGQMDHIVHLRESQTSSQRELYYNIVQHDVPWGCGRTTSSACLAGHNFPQGPFCPYLLASRLPKDQITREAVCLGAFGAQSRAEATNIPTRSPRRKDFTRRAPAYLGQGSELCLIPLSSNYIDAIMRTGQIPTPWATASTVPVRHYQEAVTLGMELAVPMQQSQHRPALSIAPVPSAQYAHHTPSTSGTNPTHWYFFASGEMPPPSLYSNQHPESSQRPSQGHNPQEPRPAGQSSNSNVPSLPTRPS